MADELGTMLGAAALSGGGGGFGGFGGVGAIVVIIVLLLAFSRGFGGFGGGNGVNGVATSNEVQRGFDNQNTMANQREILSAVTDGTAQSVAATNQSFHDMLNVVQDKYNEMTRDIGALAVQSQQIIANQNQCCCDTKLLLTEQNAGTNANIAQSRYDAAMNTAAINANMTAQTQKILDAINAGEKQALLNRVQQLELAQATSGVLRYPNSWTYNAGTSPFCGGSCGGFV